MKKNHNIKAIYTRKILSLCTLLLLLLLGISGCSSSPDHPQQREDDQELFPLLPSSTTFSSEEGLSVQASLYFRFRNQAQIAGESRMITATINESLEKKVIEGLLAGPSTATTELSSLFPEQTQVINTVSQGDTLIVTFSEDLLNYYNDQPKNWASNPFWQKEIPLRKKLSMDSLAASLLETFRYQKIQIMVQPTNLDRSAFRLQNSYYHNPSLPSGIAPFLTYHTNSILTPFDTATIVLNAWKLKDWETLYLFVSTKDYWDLAFKPSYDEMCRYWTSSCSIKEFSLSSPSVSDNGQHCFFPLSYTIKSSLEGPEQTINGVLKLTKETGIWKISFSDLEILMGTQVFNEGLGERK